MENLTVDNLSFAYPGEVKNALNKINLTIKKGEFITIIGPSGCGKSTLLKHLKPSLAPAGQLTGKVFFNGKVLSQLSFREQTMEIGFVQQNPDNQIVTDKVWHELAFGLESLGYDTLTIRQRVAEISSYFGIQNWFYKDVAELSGGQKQLLNLASIMALQPSLLILDEPTSQLDPITATDFLNTISKINRELGTTIILTEHRLDEALPLSHRVLVLDQGELIFEGEPKKVGKTLFQQDHQMFLAMPTPMLISCAVAKEEEYPITVREGRLWLNDFVKERPLSELPLSSIGLNIHPRPIIEVEDIWFRYEKEGKDILRNLSFFVNQGELLAILGGNGTGKTTALSIISGVNKPYRGKVRFNKEKLYSHPASDNSIIGLLPQNPMALFLKNTVKEDLLEVFHGLNFTEEEKSRRFNEIVNLCQLTGLLNRHPYDLSGGEQQRLALAKVLLLEPKILLLDEPTKGFDAAFKQIFAGILAKLLKKGITIIMVSHDLEFCARYAHRCLLFFDGQVVSHGTPRSFFSGNSFYTTSANRMARHLLPEAITPEEVIIACGGSLTIKPAEQIKNNNLKNDCKRIQPPKIETKKTFPWEKRKVVWALSSLFFLILILSLSFDFFKNDSFGSYFLILGFVFTLLLLNKDKNKEISTEAKIQREPLQKKTLLAAFVVLIAIPLTIFLGVYFLDNRKYYFISLLVLIEAMLPFVLLFEGRKPKARELVVIAVLCAIGVAGRGAFFMLPHFKPVAALVIISGIAFGGEVGFLVGATTMLVSNMFYGQGPWTPWQMFAMGMIGFLAGLLFYHGILRRNRFLLSLFGGIAVLIFYGGLVNPSYVLIYNDYPTWQMILVAYLQAFPFDLVHATSTAFFLWILADPMLEKLDRVKIKYGLIEK